MSEEILIQYASPTLAGLKAGNLFSVEFTDKTDMQDSIREINRILVPKGLRMIPLCEQGKRTLVYLFRPSVVEKGLSKDKAREILNLCGYPDGTMEQQLISLISRMRRKKGFPHEIGLFLGYPPEDVEGFIKNGPKNAKCTGTWKVYGDEEKARCLFQKYRHCTDIYRRQWKKGIQLEKLIVPV